MSTETYESSTQHKGRYRNLTARQALGEDIDREQLRELCFELGIDKAKRDAHLQLVMRRRASAHALEAPLPTIGMEALVQQQATIDREFRAKFAALEQQQRALFEERRVAAVDVQLQMDAVREQERLRNDDHLFLVSTADPAIAAQLRDLNEELAGIDCRRQVLGDIPVARRPKDFQAQWEEECERAERVSRNTEALRRRQLDWLSFSLD